MEELNYIVEKHGFTFKQYTMMLCPVHRRRHIGQYI